MISIRNDISAGDLRQAAETVDGSAAQRFFAIANVLDGMTREEAAKQANINGNSVTRGIRVLNAKGIKGLQEFSRRGKNACPVRDDIPARDLRQAAETVDHRTARRYLAIADVLDGDMLRKDVAKAANIPRNTLRKWILRFNAEGLGGLQDLSPAQRWPISIRDDISAGALRRAAKTVDHRVAKRFSAIADLLDGMSRAEAARKAKIHVGTLASWIVRFNTEGLEALLLTSMPIGRPPTAGIRDGISAGDLRLAAKSGKGRVAKRYLAIADVLDGMSRAEAAAKVDVHPSTLTRWIRWLNATGVQSQV